MNVAHFQDDEIQGPHRSRASNTPDGDERDAIYLRCEEVVAEKQPWVLISHLQGACRAISPEVKDFDYHPTGVAFFEGVPEEASRRSLRADGAARRRAAPFGFCHRAACMAYTLPSSGPHVRYTVIRS